MQTIQLNPRKTQGSTVVPITENGWRLTIPAGPAGRYRLAQLDDYAHLPRKALTWQPPLVFEVQARVSANDLAGTWGFGLWNDPFSATLGLGGAARRLPALPNCAWFFYASPANYLSLRNDIPAQGLLAAAFSSPNLPALALLPGLPFLPLLAWTVTARILRSLGRRVVRDHAARLDLDAGEWHTYQLEWQTHLVRFTVDNQLCFTTPVSPRGRLGLVLWIDNQFAAIPPNGSLRFGTQASPQEAWLELKAFSVRFPAR